ncbi:MAG TPA: EamA family transporter [Thermoleophilaceae bacterium]|jgi:inner membrane transporter RhtA
MPAPVLVLAAVVSTQIGSACAKGLFDDLGPGGTTFARLAFAALFLALVARPEVAGRSRRELATAGVFGLAMAGMNLCFYEAIDRIPLGIAVTIEFLGPLGVAVALSRRRLDLAWVALAATGVALFADRGEGGSLDPAGVAFILAAAGFWAAYILMSARTGRAFPGGTGLTLAMAVGAAALVPIGVADGGGALLDPALLAAGAGVALLASAIPYALEMEALRRLPTGVFGILLSMEPAVAALSGFVILDQGLGARDVVAIGLVVAASAGASMGSPATPEAPAAP